jgi:N-acyl-D-amino-acid deacylase
VAISSPSRAEIGTIVIYRIKVLPKMLDILIINGTVIDGTGKPRFRSNVAIQNDRIVEIGVLGGAEAQRVIDATGQVVCPGFVDMHSHTDYTLPISPTADNLVFQGITTAVVGNCGTSLAPLFPHNREVVIPSLGVLDGPLPWDEWGDFASYLSFQKKSGLGINIIPLVGQGTLRKGVVGFGSGQVSNDQIREMQSEIERAMDAGAYGVSTGLIYAPGSYANTAELIKLIEPVGKRHGFYFSHIRNEAWQLLEAVEEAIQIGKETGASVEVSHFKAAFEENWAKAAQALEMIERARNSGVRIQADMYPYTAGATYLSATIPEWAHDGGSEALLARLRSKADRALIIETSKTQGFFRNIDWSSVIFAKASKIPECEGRYVTELAESAHKKAWEWVMDALIETELDAEAVFFMVSEENLKLQLSYPWMMIGTDAEGRPFSGPLTRGLNHPRGFGTFPRVLGRYVRDQHVLALEDAVHRMTGLPAEFLNFQDRGVLRKEWLADLVIFDPETINDCADYSNPYQENMGISTVLVNGKFVLDNRVLTKICPGQIIPNQ